MLHTSIKERSPLSQPYHRHQPERTLHYQIVEPYCLEFRDMLVVQGKALLVNV